MLKCKLLWTSLKMNRIEWQCACEEFPATAAGLLFLLDRCSQNEAGMVHKFLIKMVNLNFVEDFVHKCLRDEYPSIRLGATRGLQKFEDSLRKRKVIHEVLRQNARSTLKKVTKFPYKVALHDVQTYVKTLKYLGTESDIKLLKAVDVALSGFWEGIDMFVVEEKIRAAESRIRERSLSSVK